MSDAIPRWARNKVQAILTDSLVEDRWEPVVADLARLLVETRRRTLEEAAKAEPNGPLECMIWSDGTIGAVRAAILALRDKEPS